MLVSVRDALCSLPCIDGGRSDVSNATGKATRQSNQSNVSSKVASLSDTVMQLAWPTATCQNKPSGVQCMIEHVMGH
jgi:hypothetical protein